MIFKLESVQIFDKMVNKINNETVATLMRGQIPVQVPEDVMEAAEEEPRQQQHLQTSHESLEETAEREAREAAGQDTRQPNRQPIVKDKLPAPNDPCPCGSGKKFKNCHGKDLI